MSECMVDDCTVKTEPGTTYEDGHKVMQRHYQVHLIEELRAINASLSRWTGNARQEAADAPQTGAPEEPAIEKSAAAPQKRGA